MKYLPRPIRKNSDLSILLLLVLVLFLIVASLMFPPSAHAEWIYIDPVVFNAGPVVLTDALFIQYQLTPAMDQFVSFGGGFGVPVTGAEGFPAPLGYYDQAAFDAQANVNSFQMDFDVPTYSALVGFFLGLFVLAYGAGAVYRLFVGRRY